MYVKTQYSKKDKKGITSTTNKMWVTILYILLYHAMLATPELKSYIPKNKNVLVQ